MSHRATENQPEAAQQPTNSPHILVVGGAGYVGSAAVVWLVDRGYRVTVLDDLSTGHPEYLPSQVRVIAGRAGDRATVRVALQGIDAVMHFAARALVEESFRETAAYWDCNVEQTRILVDETLSAGVRAFVFSSTCAVYGDPGADFPAGGMHEGLAMNPQSPYGETKVAAEGVLSEAATQKGLHAIALRYFNAAGAEPGLRVGECHEPESHLIPRLLRAALDKAPVQLNGTDYPTPDGTCVRDYVHVTDLAIAHESAIRLLLARLRSQELAGGGAWSGNFEAINLGSGVGFSNREVLTAVQEISGARFQIIEGPRRPGDPARLYANIRRARDVLGFEPGRYLHAWERTTDRRAQLVALVRSAWTWERKRRGQLRPAVFLDRDGTINIDPGYLNNPKQMRLLPGVAQALLSLQRQGFALVLITNQSGVGRGLIDAKILPQIHERMEELIRVEAGSEWKGFDLYQSCVHRPEEQCECRKPRPKLILDAVGLLGIDLSRSVMVGDRLSDILAGRNAGCGRVAMVRTGAGKESEKGSFEPDFVGEDLHEVVRWVIASQSG